MFAIIPPGPSASAETTHGRLAVIDMSEVLPPDREATRDPFLDRQAGSALERYRSWKNRMKSEHFTTYLVVYTALVSTLVGLVLALMAFRFGDPMAPYRRVRKSCLGLSLAIGAGLGVLLAVFEVPHARPDRLTLLLSTIVTALVVTLAAAAAGLFVQFQIRVRRAKLSGAKLTDLPFLR